MKNSYQAGEINLKHFIPREFTRAGFQFYKNMAHEFLFAIDELSCSTGYGIRISRHKKAIGRISKDGGASQHDITDDEWYNHNKDVVLVVADTQPFNRETGLQLTHHEAEIFYVTAVKLGFTGIGVYPHWNPMAGFHLDMRIQPKGKKLSTWGALKEVVKYEDGFKTKQVYHGFEHCLAEWSA